MKFHRQFVESLPSFVTDKPALLAALETESPCSVRYNSRKQHNATINDSVPWCVQGMYLAQRPVFTLDPLFHAGVYYVQEASSMFLSHALSEIAEELPESPRILDLCAAPGGKTTLLSDFLKNRGMLVANEVISSRIGALSENVQKWGNCNTVVTNNDASDWGQLGALFDVVVCDAPCSGEGMFRKDDEAVAQWSAAAVQHCSARQQRIIADIWDALMPGGFLIYSTCTFNEDENEAIARWVVSEFGAHSVQLSLTAAWGVVESAKDNVYVYRFFPHLLKGEGFALTVLQKSEDADSDRVRKKKLSGHWEASPKKTASTLQPWFTTEVTFFQNNQQLVRALTPFAFEGLQYMQEGIKIVHAGVDVVQVKGTDFIPQHGFSMSCDRQQTVYPTHELSENESLRFLKKETILFDSSVPQGWIIVTHNGIALGFVKNLGTRSNNAYPAEWRIRMAIDK